MAKTRQLFRMSRVRWVLTVTALERCSGLWPTCVRPQSVGEKARGSTASWFARVLFIEQSMCVTDSWGEQLTPCHPSRPLRKSFSAW